MSYPGVCMNVLVIVLAMAILNYASNATSIDYVFDLV